MPPDAEIAPEDAGVVLADRPLTINEIMASNEGAWIDGTGETDDWVELVNSSGRQLDLSRFTIADGKRDGVALPGITLAPGERVIMWLDDQLDQGPTHLPFKLSSNGDAVVLRDEAGDVVDLARFDTLSDNDVYLRIPDVEGEFETCRYASPNGNNGSACLPPEPPSLPSTVDFAPFVFPDGFAEPKGPLVITEVALRPAAFVEIVNTSDELEQLDNYVLRLSPHGPGLAWPAQLDGESIPLPEITLEPNGRVSVAVNTDITSELETDPNFEGVLTLFDTRTQGAVERVDFMHWPENAALARIPEQTGSFRFCTNTTPEREKHLRRVGVSRGG